jgi:hypothetical protein
MKRRVRARTQPPGTCYTTVTNLVTVRCARAAIKPLATMTGRIVSELLACHLVPIASSVLCNLGQFLPSCTIQPLSPLRSERKRRNERLRVAFHESIFLHQISVLD